MGSNQNGFQRSRALSWGTALVAVVAMSLPACDKRAAEQSAASAQNVTAPFTPGNRYVYAVSLVSESDVGQGSVVQLRVTGKWLVHPVKVSGEQIELWTQLTEVRAESTGAKGLETIEGLATELSAPAFVRLQGGALRETRLRRNLSAVAANVQRTLGSALQLPLGAREKATWSTFEWDATGKYEVEYTRLAESGAFRKKKKRYESLVAGKTKLPAGAVSASDSLSIVAEVVAHDGAVQLDASGSLLSARFQEELRAKLMQSSAVTSKTTLSLTRASVEPLRGAAPELTSEQLVRLADEDAYEAPAPLSLDQQRIAGMSFEAIAAELETAERAWKPPAPAPADGNESAADQLTRDRAKRLSDLFVALGAVFRQRPDAVTLAKGKIRSGSPAAEVLLNALGSSNAPGSQAALIELLQDRGLPEALRVAAVVSLVRGDRPSEAAEAALRNAADDELHREYAVYGLGTFARKLRSMGEQARSARISEFLTTRLRTEAASEHKVTALRGIANSADEGAVSAVRPYLAHEDPLLRSAAVEALRLMPSTEHNTLVAAALADEVAAVRHAALATAAVRPLSPQLVSAVEKVAKAGADGYGRMKAVELLGRWLPRAAAVKATLETVARTDSEVRIRDAAARLVANQPG